MYCRKMELYSAVVTAAGTETGVEFVKQLVGLPKPPRFVFAVHARDGTLEALSKIKESAENCQVELIPLDSSKLEEIVEARQIVEKAVGENGLTLLINCANVCKILSDDVTCLTEKSLLMHFTCNTVVPITFFQEMLPLLQKSANHNSSPNGMRTSRAAVINISSLLGSITNAGEKFLLRVRALPYKISKAALNMAMRDIASNVKEHGILVVNMCIEWVDIDMGNRVPNLKLETIIASMLRTLANLDESHHGSYVDGLGEPYPF